ncbi:MAG: methyltransferase [Candidatus Aenigmatarchaeota archaeon]|nr:MAG: methyltransferase [Candidatus Aenigmarchaeota archaeon]
MKRVFVNRTENYYKNVRDVREGIENELTISHILKSENPFTESRLPYGEILAGKLNIPDNPRILEVGPGLGDLAEGLCKSLEGFHYTFIDVSPEFINFLKSKFRGSEFSFINGDFLSEKIKEKFDLIICNEVLADLPTIVNMTFESPHVSEEDKNEYYEAVSLAKFYRLKRSEITNFNYGAVKFLEKAANMLKEGGKVFICEHSSKPPRRIRVYDHSEYTIDFDVLERVAGRLGFRIKRGSLTRLLGINKKKAVVFYTQPELKALYNFFKRQGVFLDQKAYEIGEVIELLEKNGVRIPRRKDYAEFLEKHAKPLQKITDQFNYLIMES